jgi:hypothetical protein
MYFAVLPYEGHEAASSMVAAWVDRVHLRLQERSRRSDGGTERFLGRISSSAGSQKRPLQSEGPWDCSDMFAITTRRRVSLGW